MQLTCEEFEVVQVVTNLKCALYAGAPKHSDPIQRSFWDSHFGQ